MTRRPPLLFPIRIKRLTLDLLSRRSSAPPLFFLSAEEPVGPGPRPLSGGQWQRLACARALATDSKILVFDEPSSALDSASERVLMTALLSDSRAVLAVTHRLGNAKLFDAIAVMENGSVVQFGSHDELFSVDGPYRRLWDESRSGFA